MDQDIKTVIQYPVGATEFDIPFDYLSRKFVRVSLVSDDNRRLLSNITEYRYVSKTRVKLLVATTGFDRVEIRRFTSASERVVDFSDGSVLRANDLNVSQLQSAHIAEEARDAALLAMPEDDAGNLDARNRKIVRLAPGETGTDAVNKNQLDTTLGEAGGILSEVKDLQKDIEDYLQNWGDDTTAIRGVLWVYNQGSAVGGETSFVITKEGPVLAVPYIEINGSRQYRGWHYEYDLGSKTITLAKPLSAGDLVVCTTAETTLPLADSLAGPTGASQIGTANGLNVQMALDNLRSGVNVLDFMTFAERATGPANTSPAVLGLSCGGVNTYDNDMFDIHLTIRNTNNGGHNGAILTVLLYREGGAARATIVRVDSRSNAVGEGDINSTSADPQQVYQVSVEVTSNDASTFNLLVSTKSDNNASYRFRAKVKP
ncbi:putative tail fiber (tailspike) protein [Klebsiella phage H5]|uniref:Probable tail spike protein n=1 Tax=Klebsiella phage H5 TaxID=3068605 RepID=A0AA49XAI6_9CAUD|nr:putative tail fiber (tailspike) protein [Klebsiella phage H5]